MKNKIRELRVWIDGIHQLVNSLDEPVDYKWEEPLGNDIGRTNSYILPHSKEISMSAASLLMSKYWLGEALKAIDVEITSDVETGNDWKNSSLNSHTEKVTWLIEEINRAIDSGKRDIEKSKSREKYYMTTLVYSWLHSRDHLTEATFWLNEELKRT